MKNSITVEEFIQYLKNNNLPEEYLVEDDVYLSQVFEKEANLKNGTFVRKFCCGDAIFHENLLFGNSVFKKSFTTHDAVFKKGILCEHARFEGYFSYKPSNIDQMIDIGSCSIFKARKLF